MGTRALTGFKKDGKYYMTSRKFDGGYFVAGAEILKCYINNSKKDFEEAFNMINFKNELNSSNTIDDAIKEGLFYSRYNLDSSNLIALINSKNLNMSARKNFIMDTLSAQTSKDNYITYEINGIPQIIPYSKVKHLDVEDEYVEGKLTFVNYDIFKNSCNASYLYIYDFDNDSLECYCLKWYEDYENKHNKKEILLDDNKVFRFVNTFTFSRKSRLRKYLELFESWFYVEKLFNEISEGADSNYIEEVVENNLDKYLEMVEAIRQN